MSSTKVLDESGASLVGTLRTTAQSLDATPRVDFEWRLVLNAASTVTGVTVRAVGRQDDATGEWLPMPSRPGSTGDPDVEHALTPDVGETTRDRYTVDDHVSLDAVALEFAFTGAPHNGDSLEVWAIPSTPLVQ